MIFLFYISNDSLSRLLQQEPTGSTKSECVHCLAGLVTNPMHQVYAVVYYNEALVINSYLACHIYYAKRFDDQETISLRYLI